MRAEVAADLKQIYTATTADEAEQRLASSRGNGRCLSADWSILAPELATHHSVLRLSGGDPEGDLYDYAIESVNMSLRKITKNRGSFQATKRC